MDFWFSFYSVLAGHLSIRVFILKAEKSYPYKIKVYLLTHLLDLNSNLNDGVFEKKKLIPWDNQGWVFKHSLIMSYGPYKIMLYYNIIL